jgi:hypothetical protein
MHVAAVARRAAALAVVVWQSHPTSSSLSAPARHLQLLPIARRAGGVRWFSSGQRAPGTTQQLYAALGLPNGSSQSAVKRRYFELAKQVHPDSRGDGPDGLCWPSGPLSSLRPPSDSTSCDDFGRLTDTYTQLVAIAARDEPRHHSAPREQGATTQATSNRLKMQREVQQAREKALEMGRLSRLRAAEARAEAASKVAQARRLAQLVTEQASASAARVVREEQQREPYSVSGSYRSDRSSSERSKGDPLLRG